MMIVFGYEVTARRLPRAEVKWNEDWKAGFWIGALVGSVTEAVIALIVIIRFF